MNGQFFVGGEIPERFLEVDAARLLIVLNSFARDIDNGLLEEPFFPTHPVTKHFTPEYLLQKLDFLLRNPAYLAYELVELHRLRAVTSDSDRTMAIVRGVVAEKEPELNTIPFRRFWRGAYERLDGVESYWHSRRLVYVKFESRGGARPQKHYFLTELAEKTVERLVTELQHAKWYAARVELIREYFSGLSPSQIKSLQYQHESYREAALNETIPPLPVADIRAHFESVFGEAI